MNTYSGIDVSEHNGTIQWAKVKPHISFAMIRGGYGKNTVDEKFKINALGCTNNKIPFGVYWFSYAINANDAVKEAKKCLSVIKSFTLSLPVAFDFEYDSIEYAKKRGVTIDGKLMCEIAKAFLDEIKNAGYDVLLYTNPDLWSKGFKKLSGQYNIWCAHWGAEKPGVFCDIWQDSCSGTIEGVSTKVDTDISYKYFPLNDPTSNTDKVNAVVQKYKEKYSTVATEIINGKYGNGNQRKAKLIAQQLDPNYAQDMVNAMMGD